MIDLYFYDRDGNPIPGKVPTPLVVVGEGTLSPLAQLIIKRTFHEFTQAYRLGLYEYLKKIYVIDQSTELQLQVNQGIFTAIATVKPERAGNYIGGLVVRLERLTAASSAAYLADTNGVLPTEEQRETIPFTLTGPQAVPGPLGRATTEWLIFQISRHGDLSDRPVRNGLVKMLRIANPQIGDIASHNYSGSRSNILTADWEQDLSVPGSPRTRIARFCLCGRDIGIPPTPWSDTGYSYEHVRMYSTGFAVNDFANPFVAVGTIIVAWWGQLWIYRTGGSWQTVATAEVSPALVNSGAYQPFGYDFAVTGSGATTTIECSGSNADGDCSSFTISFTPNTAAGSVSLAPRTVFEVPSLPTMPAEMHMGSWTVALDAFSPVLVDGGPGGFNDFWVFPDEAFVSSTLTATYGLAGDGASAATRDDFVGGVLKPARVDKYATLSVTRTYSQVPNGTYDKTFNFDGYGNWIAIPHHAYDQPETCNASVNLYNTVAGDISYTFTSTTAGAFDATVISGTPGGADGYVTSQYSDRTWNASFPLSGTTSNIVLKDYSAIDKHRKRLAWRQDAQRTGQWSADVNGFAQAIGTVSGSANTCDYSNRLIDATMATRVERESFLTLFNGTVGYAGGYSFTEVPSFCGRPGPVPAYPTRPQGAGVTKLFNTYLLDGLVTASGIDGYWDVDYAPHYKFGHTATAVSVPDGDPAPAHTHFYDADEGTWSLNRLTPGADTTVAGYESTGTPSGAIDVNPVPGYWTGALPVVSVMREPSDLLAYYGMPSGQAPTVFQVQDLVFVDPRTDGYIAQSWWEADLESSSLTHPSIVAYLGNEDSVTTLTAVLNEAAALLGLPSEYERVFVRPESIKDVALI